MIRTINLKKSILVFTLCMMMFTPLLIEAHNNALNQELPVRLVPELIEVQIARLSESLGLSPNAFAQESLASHSLPKRVALNVSHLGLRPKIATR
jgi:hypothetical protein